MGEERGEVLKSLSARITTFYHEKAWPCAILNQDPLTKSQDLKSWGWGGGRVRGGHTHFCKTQLCLWFFFPSRAFAFSDSKWPSILWVYKLNYKSPSKHVARSVQHVLSPDCADTNAVPLWTQSTRFWKYHQALESRSSRGGRVTNMQAHQILSMKRRKLTSGKICHKNTAVMTPFLALKKKKSSLIPTLFE